MNVADTLDLVYKEHLYKSEEERKAQQEKLYHYYNGDEKEILTYLNNALQKTFDSDTIDEFQMDYLNITNKLIKEISVVYIEPAIRTLVKGTEESEELTDYFNEILTDRISSKDKKAHRYGRLFNTALVEIFYNEFTNKIDFKIDSPHKLTVVPHDKDEYQIGLLMYDKYFKNSKGKDELYTVVWTEEEHFKLDQNGNKVAFEDNEQMINPYGVIPFAIIRLEDMDGFWGIGEHDIVNTNEIVNVMLTDLLNSTLIGAWGTPLFVNCQLEKKASDDDSSGVKKLKIGPRHPISVDNVTNEMVPPRIEYVTHNAEIDVVKNYIDWLIKTLAANKGIDPNVFLQEVKAQSGFSKVMDRINQIEIREDDLEPCKEFEKDKFRIIKAINNYLAAIKQKGYKVIDDDVELRVDFAEIGMPKTTEEKWKDREEQEKRNMATSVDWLMEDNPDLSNEDAQEILKNNKEINDSQAQPPKTGLEKILEEENKEVDNVS